MVRIDVSEKGLGYTYGVICGLDKSKNVKIEDLGSELYKLLDSSDWESIRVRVDIK